MSEDLDTDVAIVGGGPVGCALALELGRRRIRCVVLERDQTLNQVPRARMVSARSAEHLRRWGISDRLRARSWLGGGPIEVAFAESLLGPEYLRGAAYTLEAAGQPYASAEDSMWVPQPVTHDELVATIATLDTVQMLRGYDVQRVDQDDDGVVVAAVGPSGRDRVIRARYVVGADGGGSLVRKQSGISFTGQGALAQQAIIFFRCPDLDDRYRPAAFTLIVNDACIGLLDRIYNGYCLFIGGLPVGTGAADLDLDAIVAGAIGDDLPFEIWNTADFVLHDLIATTYREGRIFVAGDAAHLIPPVGGHNMNTGLDDAVNLGWKLAAAIEGWAGDALLDSYTAERRPIAERNRDSSLRNWDHIVTSITGLAELIGLSESENSADHRREVASAAWLATEEEWVSTGVQLDQRYVSAVLVPDADADAAPPWNPHQTALLDHVGHRLPHLLSADGGAMIDLLGPGYTLLGASIDVAEQFTAAAELARTPLTVIDGTVLLPDGNPRRGPALLVRPDGHVAWRGLEPPGDPVRVIDIIRGAKPTAPSPQTKGTP